MGKAVSARATTRRTLRLSAVALFVVTATIIGILVYQSAPSSATASSEAHSPGARRPAPPSTAPSARSAAVTLDDGVLPAAITVFDDGYPGLAKLDPDLLQALRKAATVAALDGVRFYVNSGWRSRKYQEQLFRQAVSTYGSDSEAARWVAAPGTSAHESGDAADIGTSDATEWLSAHGARYGLCQIYGNEPWHYELRPAAIDHGCPLMYADPTHDPRMEQ